MRQNCLGSNAEGKLRSCRGRFHAPACDLSGALCSFLSPDDKADVTAHFRGSTGPRRRFNSECLSGPFSSSHRSFPLLPLGEKAEHAFPHIASLHTTLKNSSHWASAMAP